MKNFLWINLGVFVTYTGLYFLVNGVSLADFPVRWVVYFSVHGLGLLILSMVQKSIKNQEFSDQCLKSGGLILAIGWVATVVLFMI
jgi:hypothetical protein